MLVEDRTRNVVHDLRNPEEFSAFFDAALPVVYGYFLRRTGGVPAVAEDLTQETFLAVVEQIRKDAVVSAPMPWVIGIARHRLIDYYRTNARREGVFLPPERNLERVPDDADPIVELIDRDHAIAALDALPPSQRLAISLRYLDGLSVPEVATAIGKSVHAAESLLSRGRTSFKKRYLELDHG